MNHFFDQTPYKPEHDKQEILREMSSILGNFNSAKTIQNVDETTGETAECKAFKNEAFLQKVAPLIEHIYSGRRLQQGEPGGKKQVSLDDVEKMIVTQSKENNQNIESQLNNSIQQMQQQQEIKKKLVELEGKKAAEQKNLADQIEVINQLRGVLVLLELRNRELTF